jgi:hypothetical protein
MFHTPDGSWDGRGCLTSEKGRNGFTQFAGTFLNIVGKNIHRKRAPQFTAHIIPVGQIIK